MKRQAGFTIIEIMVALTLSMLLIAGVTQIFSGNRETYRTQSGLSALQENGRFSVDVLRRDLSMARYSPYKTNLDAALGSDGGGTDSDTITVTYWSETDCTGGTIPAQNYTRTYDVWLDPATKVSSLRCNTVPVLDGVENMQVLYGVDTDADDELVPNQYVNATMVTAWGRVVAIRFALLINTLEPVSREPDTAEYSLLDSPSLPPASDMLRRRVYSGTVALRNRS